MEKLHNDNIHLWTRLEEKYPVFDWKVNGVRIWPIVRIWIAINCGRFSKEKNNKSKVKLIRGMKLISDFFVNRYNIIIKDRGKEARVKKTDVFMLGNTQYRNVCMPDGSLLGHNIDPIKMYLENSGYDVLKLEIMGGAGSRCPRWASSYYIDKMLLEAAVYREIRKRIKPNYNIDLDGYDEMLKEVEQNNIGIENLQVTSLIDSIAYVQYLTKKFTSLLVKSKPKIIVLECWYSEVKMSLILAAHKLNIPVVDIQHGVAAASGNHPSYCDWRNMPADGYELMPDYMWVWGKEDYDAMVPFAKKNLVPFIGGHPMNLIWGDSKNSLNSYYQKKYEREYSRDKPVILFTLQWGTDYPKWILDYINQDDEYLWLIRLHPVVDDNEKMVLQSLNDKDNVVKYSPDSFPLEILLKNIDIHITMNSSVVLDAVDFNCQSIVFDLACKDLYKKQFEIGLVHLVECEEMFGNKLREIICNKKRGEMPVMKLGDDCYNGLRRLQDIISNSNNIWSKRC